jgi:phage terminase large subunit-like protein
MFDKAKAERAVRIIECLRLTGDFHGQPFRIIPWQKKIIEDVYGTVKASGLRQYQHVYLEVPKKNAKSQLGSAIALLHLYDKREPNGQIVICAGDREQAEKDIYDPLIEMIEQDDALQKKVRITDSRKEIFNKDTGTLLKVISAESYTKHGWNISCVIFDELHVQPSRDLYDVMTHGAGMARRQPIWWVLTTAGDDPDRVSIAWEVHEIAATVLKARAAGDKAKDIPTWYPVIYGYQGEDIYNESNWYQANPSLGVTFPIEKLREMALEAKVNPSKERLFRWLNLSQWLTYKLTGWLPLELWDRTITAEWSRKDLLGEECYLGGDFSTTTDLSASCLIFPPQWRTDGNGNQKGHDDWRVIWDAWIPEDNMVERVKQDHVPYDQWAAQGWIYPTQGNQIDYTRIEERFLEYKKLYRVVEMGADTSFAAMLIQRLEQGGIRVVPIKQYYAELTDPMNYLEILLRSKRTIQNGKKEVQLPTLTHENNPVARWCFGNTSISRNGNDQIKYVKESKGRGVIRTKRIDLTTAWVCALARAKFYEGNRSVYEKRGVRTL